MAADDIDWREPWRPIQFDLESPRIQRQLELEITAKHPLIGTGPVAVGRRIDNDDILVVLADGTYANVHLTWNRNEQFPGKYPDWFAYGTIQDFINAMDQDAREYSCG